MAPRIHLSGLGSLEGIDLGFLDNIQYFASLGIPYGKVAWRFEETIKNVVFGAPIYHKFNYFKYIEEISEPAVPWVGTFDANETQ